MGRQGQGNRWTIGALAVVVAGSLAASLLACSPAPRGEHGPRTGGAEAPAAPPASTAVLVSKPRSSADESFLGVVVPRESVEVATQVAGRLESVDVRVGDRVKQGQPIARVDTRTVVQDLGMAEASMRAAEAEAAQRAAELAEAEKRYQRRQALPETFSREELANAHLEWKTAQAASDMATARVAEQRTRVEQLRNDVREAEIRAPFAGTVALRYLDPGAMALAGSPVVRLITSEKRLVRFAVPPQQIGELPEGTPVEARIESLGLAVRGTVRHVAPEIDPPSQMVFVEADLDLPSDLAGHVRAGLVARVSRASGGAEHRHGALGGSR